MSPEDVTALAHLATRFALKCPRAHWPAAGFLLAQTLGSADGRDGLLMMRACIIRRGTFGPVYLVSGSEARAAGGVVVALPRAPP